MLIVAHGVKLYAHYYTWSEALCSLLRMELSFTLYPVHGEKLCAHCYKSREVICSLLYME